MLQLLITNDDVSWCVAWREYHNQSQVLKLWC